MPRGIKGTKKEYQFVRVRKDYAKEIKKYFPRLTGGCKTSHNDIYGFIIEEKRAIKKLKDLQKSKEELIAENERLIRANEELIIIKNTIAGGLKDV